MPHSVGIISNIHHISVTNHMTLKKNEFGVTSSGITFKLNFMKIHSVILSYYMDTQVYY
jgi:hypothetical protein